MATFIKPEAGRASLSDRRTNHRGPVQTKARLTVLDGPSAGVTHDILARDGSMGGLAFLLRQSLEVGQQCTVQMLPGGKIQACEIIRARPISAGRYEMALQFRK